MLYWASPHGLYRAPKGIILLIIPYLLWRKGDFMAWRMYALYRVPSSLGCDNDLHERVRVYMCVHVLVSVYVGVFSLIFETLIMIG